MHTPEDYQTALLVTAKDRIGIIVDISTVLSSTKTRVSSLNARSTGNGLAVVDLVISVGGGEQLKTVQRKLEQISGVVRVTRPAG